MNIKTTIVLLVLLALCVTLWIGVNQGWFKAKEAAPVAEADKKITPGVDKVVSLTVENPKGKAVFVKQGDQWRMIEPLNAAGDTYKVESLGTTLAGLNWVRKYAAADPDFPQDDITHLSAPMRTATFGDDKGRSFTIKVGQKVPLGTSETYVQLAGDSNVYVVDMDTNLQETLNKSSSDYRKTEIADYGLLSQAVKLTVQPRGEQAFQLAKSADNWVIEQPTNAKADGEKVKSLLDKFWRVKATRFVNEKPTEKDLAGYGLDKPNLHLAVELVPATPAATQPGPTTASQPKKPHEILGISFGNAANKSLFAKLDNQPAVFLVDESAVKDLSPKLMDLRDPKVLEMPAGEIIKIEVTLAGGGSCTLEKANNDWRMKSPFEGPADEENVIKLISTLRDLKANEFRDNPESLESFGLAPPRGSIVLHFRGSDKTLTLQLGTSSTSGQMGFVRPSEGKSVAVIAAGEFAQLLLPSPNYWDRKLLTVPADQEVVGVDLWREGVQYNMVKDEKALWRLTQPVAAEADADNARQVVESMRNLKAGRLVALGKAVPEKYAALKPVRVLLSVQAKTPAGAPAAASATTKAATGPATTKAASGPATASAPAPVVKLGPVLLVKDAGKAFAWREGTDPVAIGEIGNDVYDHVTAELRDRAILKLDPEKATAFKLSAGTLSLEFTKADDQWTYSGDRFVKIDNQKIVQFLSALRDLKATKFAEYSAKPDLARYGLDKPKMSLEVTLEGGKVAKLSVGGTGPVGVEGHYATSSESPGVFVLPTDTPTKMTRTLEDFKKAEGGPGGFGDGMPPMPMMPR